jgi:predicted ATPase
MTIQDQIFAWVRTFPAWKQELYLRAAATPELREQDITEVAAILLGEPVDGVGPRAVTREDLPGASGSSEPMILESISELLNVNALPDGQTLQFASEGLNIVFGKNGAGKTGYSRVLGHAGRTLHAETVLTRDCRGGEGPRATVTVRVGKARQSVPLDLSALAPGVLARICVADSKAGESYLTSATEVDYVPGMLAGVNRLAVGLKLLDAELERRMDDARPSALDLKPYTQGTGVWRLLAQLADTTEDEAVTSLATLSGQEQVQLAKLRRKRGEIDAQQTSKLRESAQREAAAGRRLLAELRRISAAVGMPAVEALREREQELADAREAVRLASEAFLAEPLSEIGSGPWRMLFDAARGYAEHLGLELPDTHEIAYCPLCMQELSDEARQRLDRFDRFVADEVTARMQAAERTLAAARESLPDVAALRIQFDEAIRMMDTGARSVGQAVSRWMALAEQAIDRLRRGEHERPHGLAEAPIEEIDHWVASRERERTEHAQLEESPEREKVQKELAELEARIELGRRLEDVLAHLAGLRHVQTIRGAKAKTGTSSVSNKITALSRELIEADLQGALNRQLQALDFRGLAVEARSKTVRGTPMVSLRFKTIKDVPLDSVLSHGEQRRLALAMFLAEMEVRRDCSPIVLDDPVSSVDQEGRRHIARCLRALAVHRQVVVFTHELSFVHELRRGAPAELPMHIQHVRRIGETTGHVAAGLPWEGLKAKQRVDVLHRKLKEADERYEIGDTSLYMPVVIEFCEMLRSSFERATEEEILAEVITRRSDAIHTAKLQEVNVSQTVCELVDRGVDDSSPWMHDRPLADGAEPPTPQELREGLDLYERLLKTLKEDRREGKAKPRFTQASSLSEDEVPPSGRRAELQLVSDKEPGGGAPRAAV